MTRTAAASGPAGEVTIFAGLRKRGRPGRRQDSNQTPVKCCLQTCSPSVPSSDCRFCVCVRKYIICGPAPIGLMAICVPRVTSLVRRQPRRTLARTTGRNTTSEIGAWEVGAAAREDVFPSAYGAPGRRRIPGPTSGAASCQKTRLLRETRTHRQAHTTQAIRAGHL